MNYKTANDCMVDNTVKTTHNDPRTIFVIVLFIFTLIIIIVLLLHIHYVTSKYLPIDKCVPVKGEFAIVPGKKGQPMRNCINNINCSFEANTLADAIDICLNNNGTSFSYDSGTKTVSLIHETLDLTEDPTYDTYFFQG